MPAADLAGRIRVANDFTLTEPAGHPPAGDVQAFERERVHVPRDLFGLENYVFLGVGTWVGDSDLLGEPAVEFVAEFFEEHLVVQVADTGAGDVVDLGDETLLVREHSAGEVAENDLRG